ncbi:MAG: hypothetical protein JSR33_09860, partial [Proteobacteria bacterium]|nr:hypothetical protein [Pseudomonadota bacterium]
PHSKLLSAALQFTQVIVTTRDYQLPPVQIRFDQQLVNIGFTNEQIKHYLQHYTQWLNPAPAESKTRDKESKYNTPSNLPQPTESKLSTALQQNPRLWALAHVPLHLALIVEAFDDKLADSDSPKIIQDISLTGLYLKVLECFLLRQLKRQDVKPEIYTWQTLRDRQFIALDALSLLAWEAFQVDEIVLSVDTQRKVLNRLTERYPKLTATDIEAHFLQALNMGLLRSEGVARKNPLDQVRYFIHLTFQEYFTAYYLLQNLQGYYEVEAYEHSLTWISQHKYEPRYTVVMGFLAGLSAETRYNQALHAFWHAILSPPHDIIGASHIRLVMRCLEEAGLDKRIPARKQLLDLLPMWMNYALQYWDTHVFCDNDNSENDILWFIESLSTCPRLLRDNEFKLVECCIQGLQDEPKRCREAAAQILGIIGPVAPTAPNLVPALLRAVENKEVDVENVAEDALNKIGFVAPTTQNLVSALQQEPQDTDEDIQEAADTGWNKISILASATQELELDSPQDTERSVRDMLEDWLGKDTVASPSKIQDLAPALLKMLQKNNGPNVQLDIEDTLAQIPLTLRVACFLDLIRQPVTRRPEITKQTIAIYRYAMIIQDFPGMLWHADSLRLQLITGTQMETISTLDVSTLKSLLAEIKEQCNEDGLPPPPTLAQCQGKTPRYSAATKPPFKSFMIPISSIVPVKPDEKQTVGGKMQDEALSRSQRVKARLKLTVATPSLHSLIAPENCVPEPFPKEGFNGDSDLKLIRQCIYNHNDYKKINYLGLYVGIPYSTARRFFVPSPYHQFKINKAGTYIRSHKAPHSVFVGKIHQDYKLPELPKRKKLKGPELVHLGQVYPPEQALQNSQQSVQTNKNDNDRNGDGNLYDILLTYRNKVCHDIEKKFSSKEKEVALGPIIPGVYNEYPCVMVYTPFFFDEKAKLP